MKQNSTNQFKPIVVSIDYEGIKITELKLQDLAKNLNNLAYEYRLFTGQQLTIDVLNQLREADVKPFMSKNGRNYDIEKFELKKLPSQDLLNLLKLLFFENSVKAKNLEIAGIKINQDRFMELMDLPDTIRIMELVRNISILRNDWFKSYYRELLEKDFSNILTGGRFDTDIIKDKIIEFYTSITKEQKQNDLVEILSNICDYLNKFCDIAQIEKGGWTPRAKIIGMAEGAPLLLKCINYNFHTQKWEIKKNLLKTDILDRVVKAEREPVIMDINEEKEHAESIIEYDLDDLKSGFGL